MCPITRFGKSPRTERRAGEMTACSLSPARPTHHAPVMHRSEVERPRTAPARHTVRGSQSLANDDAVRGTFDRCPAGQKSRPAVCPSGHVASRTRQMGRRARARDAFGLIREGPAQPSGPQSGASWAARGSSCAVSLTGRAAAPPSCPLGCGRWRTVPPIPGPSHPCRAASSCSPPPCCSPPSPRRRPVPPRMPVGRPSSRSRAARPRSSSGRR